MSITVAELQTELTVDQTALAAGLESGTRKINNWATQDFEEAKLDVNIEAAKAAISALRTQWRTLRREMEQEITIGVAGARPTTATVGGIGATTTARVGTSAVPVGAIPRASTVKPERIAAATAATIEQINQISERQQSASAQRVQQIAIEGAAKAQATTTQGAARAAATRETAEVRIQTRLEQIREEFAVRQQLKEEARANKPLPTRAQTLSKAARRLNYQGQEQVQSGAMLTGMITAPLVGATALVTKIGIDWQSEFADVRKTVGGTTADFALLEHQLRDMAAGQKPIPIDVAELAQIAEAAGQLGIKTPAIAEFTRTVADLGSTTNLSSTQAADAFARFANILQMPQTEFHRLGSVVVDLGNKTAATESEIVEMATRLAGVGHQVNLTAPQIMGFAAALSSVGVEAESGGTAFTRVFRNMAQAVREGGKELNIYAKTAGVSSKEFKKSFETDAAGAAVAFINGLGRMKDAGGNVFGTLKALELGEVRVSDALLRASGAGDLFASSLRIGEKAWRDNNALTKEAETRYATTASQLHIFTNRLREQGIEISSHVLPVLNKLITSYGNTLPTAIGASVDAFAALPAPAQKSVIALTAMVALAGPAQMAAGNIKLLAGAFTTLWAAAAGNPAVAIAAVIALAGGYLVLSNTFDRIATEQDNLKRNTNELNAGMKRMLDVLPEGSKHAVAIQKIREEINAAGTDVGKLDKASRDLAKVKAEIKIDVKNPDLKLVMSDEVDRAQALLDQRELSVKVVVQSVYKNVMDNAGLTNPGRPIWEMSEGGGGSKSWVNNAVDWAQGWGWNGEGKDDKALSIGEDMEAEKAREAGSKHAKALKEAARNRNLQGFRLPGVPDTTLRNPITGRPLNEQPSGVFTTPTVVPYAPTGTSVEEARARLLAGKPKAATKPTSAPATTPSAFEGVNGDEDKADKKAEREREKREREAQAALERWRSHQAQMAEASAHPWERLGDTLSGLTTRLDEFDKKTDAARLRAQMARSAFDGIDEPIKQAAIAMAVLLDKTEELGKQRDAMRENNVATLGSLMRGGADLHSVLGAIGAQEKVYNFGGRIDDARTKAQKLGNYLGPLAESEARQRNDYAQSLREQNDPSSYGAAPPGKVSGDAITAMAKEVHNSLPKFSQTCAWAVSSIYDKMHVALKTENNNRAASLVAYAKAHWRQVDAATAPPGAMLAEKSETANSGWHVSVSTGGRHRAGSNNRRFQGGSMKGDAIAFVPPELDGSMDDSTPSVALGNKTAPKVPAKSKPRKEAPLVGADGKLLPFTAKQLETLLTAWGPMVTDNNVRPGESRSFRIEAQDKMFARLAAGEKMTPQQIKADRNVANKADTAKARVDATNGAALANKAFNKTEDEKSKVLAEARKALDESGGSVAAYERAAFMAQKRIEIWNSAEVQALWNQKRKHEANQLAAGMLDKEGKGYDAQKDDQSHSAATAQTKQQTQATALLNDQRDYLAQNAGLPEKTIARELDFLAKRQAEVNRLLEEKKGISIEEAGRLADQYLAGERLNEGLSNRIELFKALAQAQREMGDQFDALDDENASLGDSSLNRGQRDRQNAVDAAKRSKSRELEDGYVNGDISESEFDLMVQNAGDDAYDLYDAQARNRKGGGDRDAKSDHSARMAGMDERARKIGSLDAGNPELQIQLQLLQKRNELNEQNTELVGDEKIDVEKRLKQYEEEIRAEDKISRLSQSRQNLSSAIEETLQLQKEHELLMVHTAAERLAIEQKYQNLLNERRGIETSADELVEQAKHRDIAQENEDVEKARAVAGQIRDLMSQSMSEGAKNGVSAMVKHWISGMAQMAEEAGFNRIATGLTNKIFGANLEMPEGDIFNMKKGRKSKDGDGQGQTETSDVTGKTGPLGVSIGSFTDALRRKPIPLAPDIDITPFAPTKKRGILDGLLGGGKGEKDMQFQTATIHIETATEYIERGTIYNSSDGSAPSTGGAGSSRSLDQAFSVMGFFSRKGK